MNKRNLSHLTTAAGLILFLGAAGCFISKKETVHEEPQPTVIHEKEVIHTQPEKERVIIHDHD